MRSIARIPTRMFPHVLLSCEIASRRESLHVNDLGAALAHKIVVEGEDSLRAFSFTV